MKPKFTDTQQKALAIVPKVSSILSLLGSTYIIYDVIRMKPNKRKSYHRILFGLSTCDILCSLFWFLTTWPIPRDVYEIWGASGTQQTCSLQGFFSQFTIASVVYNASLSIYYYLIIRRGWTQKHLNDSRIERWMHAGAILMGLVTSSVSVGLGLMNPIGWECWIAPMPLNCNQSFQNSGGDVKIKCIRGNNADLYRWIFFYIPLWLIIVGVTIIMVMIVRKFNEQDRKNVRYGENSLIKNAKKVGNAVGKDELRGSAIKNSIVKARNSLMKARVSIQQRFVCKRKIVRDLQKQSIFYVGSFYFVWLFPTILRVIDLAKDSVPPYHWIFLSASFLPIQGFLNMIVYLRPQYLKVKRRRKARERKAKALAKKDEGKEEEDEKHVEGEVKVGMIKSRSMRFQEMKEDSFQTYRDLKQALFKGDDGAGAEFEDGETELTKGMESGNDGIIPADSFHSAPEDYLSTNIEEGDNIENRDIDLEEREVEFHPSLDADHMQNCDRSVKFVEEKDDDVY